MMAANVPEEGETVQWQIRDGQPPFGGTVTGTVIETGLEKFGHDDVIRVDTGADEAFVRPKDLI